MKNLLILILFFNLSYSLEISVDYAKYKGVDYSIMNIKNNTPFKCKKESAKFYKCFFDKLPDTPVFETNTIFFHIKPIFHKNQFFLEIHLKSKSIIKSFKKNLYKKYIKSLKPLSKAKKWIIIAYKKRVPFLTNKPLDGLKFPLKVPNDNFFIGAIGVNGKPIGENTQTADVDRYFAILRGFNENKPVLDDINSFIKIYPKSLFMPDILFLKIKILNKEGKQDELLNLTKLWIKHYSSNENLPEVILITAKTYSAMGFMSDATYFYERLFTEYPTSKFSYEAMVYLADQLYMIGDDKKAFDFYNKALMLTKDINVASLAASRLGQRYMEKGEIKKSVSYYEKIYKSNKNYILKNRNYAFNLAKELASHEQYSLAIKIMEDLFKKMRSSDDNYETSIYYLALWNYEFGNYKESLKYINKYSKKFQDFGNFSRQIAILRDKALFQVDDKNTTKMMQNYNEIIKNYQGQNLAKKALYKKIMLLNKLKKYKEILNMKDEIATIPDSMFKKNAKKVFIENIAKTLTIKNFDKNCFQAIKYYKEYNLTLSKKYDEKLYKCAYKIRKFDIASIVCNKYLDSFNSKIALKWSINKERVLKETGDYQGVVNIVNDICNLDKKCDKFRYDKFYALWKLGKYQDAIALSQKIEKNGKIKNIDMFYKIISYGRRINNNLLIFTYAKKIVDYQNRYKVSTYSPNIEFLLVQKAKILKKMKVAKETLIELSKKNISPENKARVFYELSNITNNKSYLKKCIKIKKSKTWRPLCQEALSL